MANKSKRARLAPEHDLSKSFAYWAFGIFVLKVIVSININGGAWYAADGVNYVKGAEALLNDGIFADQEVLTYWPAGYPIVMYALSIFGINWLLSTVGIFQSALYSFAVFYFVTQLLETRLRKFAKISFFLILLNPTLSLSSLSIGYESLAASGSLIIIGIIAKDLSHKAQDNFITSLILVAVISGILTFIQPRLIVAGVLTLVIWIFARKPRKTAPYFLIISMAIILLFPSSLIFRNEKASGISAISTNLGVTMNIGAGDLATGGYDSKERGVECEINSPDPEVADSKRVLCVLDWYLDNPAKTAKLFYNKSIYFWSPWSGPVLSGTMRLNPWLKINPVTNIIQNPEGAKLIYGAFGKFMAYLWIFSGLILLIYGFLLLWRAGGIERLIGIFALVVIFSSWAITLISIGDHRFRLPIMGMSLFLQSVGIKTLLAGRKSQIADQPSLR